MSDRTASYDLVVFGATGFVGRILCRYLLDQVGINGSTRWAIAGRSIERLEQLTVELDLEPGNLPQIKADATDETSLQELCAQTKVVISTVGPYAIYGEPLVKACAETGTHYCDLTGEPQWVQQMIERYSTAAQNSGAYIVHCCGFDSIPSDLGVYYLQQQAKQRFGQYCDRVKMRLKSAKGGVSGGTIASGINVIKEARADRELRQALNDAYSLCPSATTPSERPPLLVPVQYDPDFQSWVSPFVMAAINTRIVLRSNALLECAYGENFYYEEAVLTGSGATGWLVAQGLSAGLRSAAIAAAFSPTRWLLQKTIVPKQGEGPSLRSQAEGFYDLRFWGTTSSQESFEVRLLGDKDPGYGSTAKLLGQTGLCMAQDLESSVRGGFWTPASLLGNALLRRLVESAGLTFEVC